MAYHHVSGVELVRIEDGQVTDEITSLEVPVLWVGLPLESLNPILTLSGIRKPGDVSRLQVWLADHPEAVEEAMAILVRVRDIFDEVES